LTQVRGVAGQGRSRRTGNGPGTRRFTFLAGLIGAGIIGAAAALGMGGARAEEIARLTLDDTAALGTQVSIDTEIKAEGAGSVRVVAGWPTVVNLITLDNPGVENATVVYEAQVRAQDLAGAAYLEMWCEFSDGAQYFSRGLDSAISGTSDWQTLRTVFYLREGQRPDKFYLNLTVEGRGTVWIDDLRLSTEPLPQPE
jgi:hypothetical protein